MFEKINKVIETFTNRDNKQVKMLYDMDSFLNKLPKPESFKERMKDRIKLLREMSVNDVEEIICKKYDIEYKKGDTIFEIYMLGFYIYYYNTRNVPNTIIEYYNNDTYKLERAYLRLTLLKYGWKPSKIESVCSRYYHTSIEKEEDYMKYYTYMSYILGIDGINLQRGRPRIPEEIKDMLKKQRNRRLVQKVHTNNKVAQKCKEITKEEVEELINFIQQSCAENKEHYLNTCNKIMNIIE